MTHLCAHCACVYRCKYTGRAKDWLADVVIGPGFAMYAQPDRVARAMLCILPFNSRRSLAMHVMHKQNIWSLPGNNACRHSFPPRQEAHHLLCQSQAGHHSHRWTGRSHGRLARLLFQQSLQQTKQTFWEAVNNSCAQNLFMLRRR